MMLLLEMSSFGLLDQLSLEQLLLRRMKCFVLVLPLSCYFCIQRSLEIHLPIQTLWKRGGRQRRLLGAEQ